MRGGVLPLVSILSLLTAFPSSAVHLPEPPQESFGETIDVGIDTVVVRAVDGSGQPILGLGPHDFRVVVHGREVPVAAVDWVSSARPAAGEAADAPLEPGVEVRQAGERPEGAGKLVVFFVQADLEPTRISGQMRIRPFTRALMASLQPADRAAVVSFDSHLKLRLDFTDDREAVLAALDRGVIYSPDETVVASSGPSLAARFDRVEALRVASPEKALERTAHLLSDLPGEKTMIYLGWGLGSFGGGGVRMVPGFKPAVAALIKARTSVFVLDVTSADEHSLAAGLQIVAASTGGTYESTFRLPAVATARVARAISGWYVLTFDRDLLAGIKPGQAEIALRDRRGEVLARPVVLR